MAIILIWTKHSITAKEDIEMPSLYKSSGYNLDRMELTWMWLDAQAEQVKEKEDEGK
jgi:hypothetical protein